MFMNTIIIPSSLKFETRECPKQVIYFMEGSFMVFIYGLIVLVD